MADFTIKQGRTVWLHHRPWRSGSEDRLQAIGFTRDEKREQLRRGAIELHDPAADLHESGFELHASGPELHADVPPIEDVEAELATPAGFTPLENRRVEELREMARDNGIDLTGCRLKSEIIAAIRGQVIDSMISPSAEETDDDA